MNDIWLNTPNIEAANQLNKNTAVSHLGIKFTEIGPDYIVGTMPADERTFQPFGLIHGGANVLLAETLGSFGANLCLDNNKQIAVGQEINANHLRGIKSGVVTGTAKVVHKGRTSQVWEIRIEDEQGNLSCISRLTMAIVNRQ